MKKGKVSLKDLIIKNKEELLKDKVRMEKIERSIEDKYIKRK